MIKEHKFIVSKTTKDAYGLRSTILKITSNAMHICFAVGLKNTQDDLLAIEMAKTELKLKMIQDILNAEWINE